MKIVKNLILTVFVLGLLGLGIIVGCLAILIA